MSVAGILASTLFSGAGTQYAQQTPLSTFGTSSAPSAFAAVQQKLLQSSSTAQPSTASLPSELSQLGQDLKLGNLAAAQADYSALKIAIAQHHTRSAAGGNSSSQAAASGMASQSGTTPDPLTAAMMAYSSLQQNPTAGALSSSLMAPVSTFSIDA